MKKRLIIMIIALLIVFGGIFGFLMMRGIMMKKYFASFEQPPVVISSAKVNAKTWQPTLDAVGDLSAVNGVAISSEVSGIVKKIYFDSGQLVEKGDLLVELRDEVDTAELQHNEATLKLAQQDYQRHLNLAKQNAVALAALDSTRAALDQAQATLTKTKALLEQKHIRAPFSGKLGIRKINVGQYIAPSAEIVSLQSLNPLYINFSLPEDKFKHLYLGQPIDLKIPAYQNEKFTGKVTAINSNVSTATHNILIQGTVENANNRLYPGMFATLHVILPEQKDVLTIPQTAVNYSLYGNSVYVINQDGNDAKGKPILKAHRVYVTLGETEGNDVIVSEGLKAGQEIITSGQLKLEDNSRVEVNNSIQLKNREKK
ncbi:MAG: efflux RND transporter periplasmic adaptor subunit [Proteobacteria bacterium]|nr:efflux RND transporter periplasmic adaptor subunit [Pseudomonadota bacterium]